MGTKALKPEFLYRKDRVVPLMVVGDALAYHSTEETKEQINEIWQEIKISSRTIITDRWVRIEDCKPPLYEQVIIQTKDGKVVALECSVINGKRGFSTFEGIGQYYEEEVEYWQPLPKAK